MVDDPSAHPDLFPTEKAQEKERQRLFRIIEGLVQWENTTNETVLQAARDEIWQRRRNACAENEGRCLVTFNRNDFIELSRLYLDAGRPHSGVIMAPYTFRGNEFRQTAEALAVFASRNTDGLPPYAVAFLSPA